MTNWQAPRVAANDNTTVEIKHEWCQKDFLVTMHKNEGK
jgi:hypothetical protein